MSGSAKRHPVELVLITGLSGSGKSTVAKCFEDLGYYCVDNLPPSLLRSLLLDPLTHLGEIDRVAVVTDVRAPGFSKELPALIDEIDRDNLHLSVVYLDCSEETLVRRFSETRRRHPLSGSQALIDAIREERSLLTNLRGLAGTVFDTSDWSIHDVRSQIYKRFANDTGESPNLVVWLTSFGYKHGIPYGTDLLFDVRFLINPYFEPELRELSGQDEAVLAFMRDHEGFEEFLERLHDFLLYLLPQYRRENRSYLSVSIGCTGGRHRSVAVCGRLATLLSSTGLSIRVEHRDIEK